MLTLPSTRFAAFTFFLFAVYAVFGTMLAIFRADLVQEEAALPELQAATGSIGAAAPAVPQVAVPPGAAK